MKKEIKRVIIYVCLAIFLISGTLMLTRSFARGDFSPEKDLSYKVVQIKKGDTLWSIAKENDEGFEDIRDYIKEVKRCNQLTSDHITAGHYLMIPYYK